MRTASIPRSLLLVGWTALAIASIAVSATGCQQGKSHTPAPSRPAAVDAAVAALPTDLTGIVQDSGGTPLPDALVIAWPKGKHGTRVAQARSGEDGRFVLPQLRPGTWTLLAEAAGFGTLERDQNVPLSGSLTLALDGHCHPLEGVVVQDGHPQSGAHVILGGPGLRWSRETSSDDRGLFRFFGLGLGRFALRATRGPTVSAAISVIVEEEQKTPHVRLALATGAEIEGRVLNDRGEPVNGATVDALTVPSDDLPTSAQADAHGQYRMGPVPPGRYQLLARTDGHVPLDAPEHQILAGTKTKHDLHLARAARLTGRVRDDKGLPLAGVSITAVSLAGGRDELTVVAGPLPLAAEAADLPPAALARHGSSSATVSNLMGEYSLTGLPPGPARLDFVHPDKLPYRREPLLLAPGESRELDEAVLLAGVSLAGQVTDEEGHPVDGAQIEAHPTPKSTRQPVQVSADVHGQFALRVPAGDYALTVHANGFQPLSVALVRAMSGVALDPVQARLRRAARSR